MPFDARTHERIAPVDSEAKYYCDRCKTDVTLIRKMHCWLCSKCRLVLVNE